MQSTNETFSWEHTASRVQNAIRQPTGIFSTLLLIGPDLTSRAVAQQCGIKWRAIPLPLAFSFGWVGYSISLLVSALGEEKLMPALADSSCIVMNGKSGYCRSNKHWVIGRLVRDYNSWMETEIREKTQKTIREISEAPGGLSADIEDIEGGPAPLRPVPRSLCVAVYDPSDAIKQSVPTQDWIAWSGFVAIVVQVGLSVAPLVQYEDPTVILITVLGTVLAYISISLRQWRREKWACRVKTEQSFVLTKGNGSQHAIVITGNQQGLNLEDLAMPSEPVDGCTKACVCILALGSVFLLVMAASLAESFSNWYLLAIGGIGMAQNTLVAFKRRKPSTIGIHLRYKECFIEKKVMNTLKAVERKYSGIGRNMTSIFFPSGLNPEEERDWDDIRNNQASNAEAESRGESDGRMISQDEGGPMADTHSDAVVDASAADQ
ncbi:hypothetical protein K491DRAFT_611237 [Lophiostoma macrostomum CBS 122681]|uniref:Uncharacterized protein n=1 Tax=Lophiostoma macrostomum CBS 122681 TaxID=1314788 RepID=A0A6A6SN14_9PLEO|nr:hypothetical protein K491DRAFT_611237 [Lophiostoma macrostomum CBS 122681]